MEILIAHSLEEVHQVLDNQDREKLVLNGIEKGDPAEWDQTDPKQLGNTELRLAAITKKLGEESGEVWGAAEGYIDSKTRGEKRRILEELADVRRAYYQALDLMGWTDEAIKHEQQRKEIALDGKTGGFDRWIFMSSKRRQKNG